MNIIRAYLIENGETPQAFAQRIGIGKNQAYNLANGTFRRCPWVSTLDRIATATGIAFEDLYDEFIAPYEQKRDEKWHEKRQQKRSAAPAITSTVEPMIETSSQD